MQGLPEAARTYLEETMATRERRFHLNYLQESYEKGEAAGEVKGEARGEAKAILAGLRTRGIDVPEDICERIAACTDTDLLDVLIERAVTVRTAHELFEMPDAA